MKNVIAGILGFLTVVSCHGKPQKDTSVHEELNFGSIVGVYLPVEYIRILEKTKNVSQAWEFNEYIDYNENLLSHDVLIVDFETITAQDRMYDGATQLYIWEIVQYRFGYADNAIIVIDGRGNRYKKITEDIYDVKEWYEHVCNFIGKIVLDRLIQSGDVTLEKAIMTFNALDNRKFSIERFDSGNYNLRLDGITDFHYDLYLEIRDNEYIFYGGYPQQIVWSRKF